LAYGKGIFHPAKDPKVTKAPLSAPDAAQRRFMFAHLGLLGGFTVVMVATTVILARVETPWMRWVFAIGPVALLAVWAWEFFRMIRSSDEMMQAVHLRAVALSTGTVLVAASLWDILARLLPAPALPTFLLLPASAMVYSIAIAILAPRQ
jgi:uncharacterized membrane protein